jgi:hypothetical protein
MESPPLLRSALSRPRAILTEVTDPGASSEEPRAGFDLIGALGVSGAMSLRVAAWFGAANLPAERGKWA